MSFLYMPNEILVLIFNFCDEYTLCQISMVCKQFYSVACDILNKRSKHLLVTNEKSEKFRERCKLLLSSYKVKFITHCNWKDGKCNKRKLKIRRLFDIPSKKCIQMTKNTIWFGANACLLAYNRTKNGTIVKNKRACGITNSHISDIAYCNDIIISGHKDGSIRHWKIESHSTTNNIKLLKEIHDDVKLIEMYNKRNELEHIDTTPQHIITSYFSSHQEGSIKIQKNTHEIDDFAEKTQIFHRHKYFSNSILFDPEGVKFAASFSLLTFPYSSDLLVIYDINKCHSVIEKIYDDFKFVQLLWEDPQTILLLNNNYIKKMDLRTSEFVHTWDASFLYEEGRELSCFSSDNLYTIVTGTCFKNIILWDQRQSAIIQTYDVNQNDGIYCVEFDSAHMYAVTSNNLVEFDFALSDNRVIRANRK